jgi:ABC-2 type transport system permease protein
MQTAVLSRTPAPASAGVLLPAFTLWWREIVRFYRQKSRVVGVLASPLVFWVVIGSGFGTSFRSGGGQGQQNYLDYFYPGALIMIVLFTSIFAMMSLIEDRKEGFLLSVMVAPVPRSAIVLGKVLGGTTLSAIQGMIFLIFAPFAGIHLNLPQVLLVAVVVFLVSFRADRAWLRHRLAYGFHTGLPRHH